MSNRGLYRIFILDRYGAYHRADTGSLLGMPILGYSTKREALRAAKKKAHDNGAEVRVIRVPDSPTCDLWGYSECFQHGAKHVVQFNVQCHNCGNPTSSPAFCCAFPENHYPKVKP